MRNLKFKIIICLLFTAIFAVSLFANPQTTLAECSIQSATFTPSGDQSGTWYADNNKPQVRIDVVGNTDCAGVIVKISIVEKSITTDDDIAQLNEREMTFLGNNSFSINLRAGESECGIVLLYTNRMVGFDCNYYIRIDDYNQSGDDFTSDGRTGGNLRYECDGLWCLDNWIVDGINLPPPPPPPDPPSASTDTTYTPLAPLPCTEGMPGCVRNNGRWELQTFDTDSTNNPHAFSTYINIMIKLIIGLIAVSAVVMIFLGGIEYMTSEVISSKEHGKERIRNAILGLLLALGAYALLNTINPDLLKSDLNIQSVELDIENDVETAPSLSAWATSAPSGVVGNCREGIEEISTSGGNFFVCKRIATNLRTMINLAWSQTPQIKIRGYSLRTPEGQIQRRIANCGGNTPYNIHQKPANECTPPTARPGRSRHESGLAFDLLCDGNFIKPSAVPSTGVCFTWLQQHAGQYGFSNLSSEPWHWSVDGQ